MEQKPKLQVKTRAWIADESGETVIGLGRLQILERVQELGSLHAAAKELDMSYRAIWGKIKKSEKSLGFPLLERQIGGASGGGSELTPEAQLLVKEFKAINDAIKMYSDQLFHEKFACLGFVDL